MKKTILTIFIFFIIFTINAKQYFGSITIDKFNVEVLLNDSTQKAIIKMTGPSKAWFSIGFTDQNQNKTYAIFANELSKKNISERILNIDSITYLKNEFLIKNYTDSGNLITYIIERSLNSKNDRYSFIPESGKIDILLSIGSNPNIGTYYNSTRTSTTLDIIELNSINTKKNYKSNFLKIFPNPVKDKLNIVWNNKIKLTEFKISLGNGEIFNYYTAKQTNNKIIDVSALVPGTYFMSIKNEDWNSYFVFFKE